MKKLFSFLTSLFVSPEGFGDYPPRCEKCGYEHFTKEAITYCPRCEEKQ